MITDLIQKTPKHLPHDAQVEFVLYGLGYLKQPDGDYIAPGGRKVGWREAMFEALSLAQDELTELDNEIKELEIMLGVIKSE